MSAPHLLPPENPPEPAGAWVGSQRVSLLAFTEVSARKVFHHPHLTAAGPDVPPPRQKQLKCPATLPPPPPNPELAPRSFHLLHHPWSGYHHSGLVLKQLPNPPHEPRLLQ